MSSTETLDNRDTGLIHVYTSIPASIAAIPAGEKRSGMDTKILSHLIN